MYYYDKESWTKKAISLANDIEGNKSVFEEVYISLSGTISYKWKVIQVDIFQIT